MNFFRRILNWLMTPTSTAVPRCPPLPVQPLTEGKTKGGLKSHFDTSVVSGPPPSPKRKEAAVEGIEYADYIHKVIYMNKNLGTISELTTWRPEIIQFLMDNGIIANLPEEGEQIRIIIKRHESDDEESWDN